MTTPLSQDLRRRIVGTVEKGSSIRQAGGRYEVSPSAAMKLMRRLRETGSTKPDRVGGLRPPVVEPHQDLLRSPVEVKSGITLSEVQAELRAGGFEVQAHSGGTSRQRQPVLSTCRMPLITRLACPIVGQMQFKRGLSCA
jgi:putative transposase